MLLCNLHISASPHPLQRTARFLRDNVNDVDKNEREREPRRSGGVEHQIASRIETIS